MAGILDAKGILLASILGSIALGIIAFFTGLIGSYNGVSTYVALGQGVSRVPNGNVPPIRVKATLMSLADEKGSNVILDTIDDFWAVKIARVATIRMGGLP